MPADNPIVIATYSRRMRLRLPDGREVDARIKGKRLQPVCADRVEAGPIENESDWLITAVLERDNELCRPNQRGQIEVLAANIELLLVVIAPSPDPDWFIVDRYLGAAENMGVPAAVVFNKTDLEHSDSVADDELLNYAAIGYPIPRCSTRTGSGMNELQSLLDRKTAIVVGQSGVGKSSIINHLADACALPTAEMSAKRGEGRHTTVNSTMISLPNGAAIIDSPGVRDFAPALQETVQVGQGFREVQELSNECRFADCRHTREPDCAVKQAVADQRISPRRYESYKRLLNLTERLSNKT